jgi:hypothetical protein
MEALMSDEIRFAEKTFNSARDFAQYLNTPNHNRTLPIFDTGNRKDDVSEKDFAHLLNLASDYSDIDKGLASALKLTHAPSGSTAGHRLSVAKLKMLMDYSVRSPDVEAALMEIMEMPDEAGFPWQRPEVQDLWVGFYADNIAKQTDNAQALQKIQEFKSGVAAGKGYTQRMLEVQTHLAKLRELESESYLTAVNTFQQVLRLKNVNVDVH